MGISKIHIGNLIKSHVKGKIKDTEFAEKIGKTRQNVYDLYKRDDVSVKQLLTISQVLQHNFFADLYQQDEMVVDKVFDTLKDIVKTENVVFFEKHMTANWKITDFIEILPQKNGKVKFGYWYSQEICEFLYQNGFYVRRFDGRTFYVRKIGDVIAKSCYDAMKMFLHERLCEQLQDYFLQNYRDDDTIEYSGFCNEFLRYMLKHPVGIKEYFEFFCSTEHPNEFIKRIDINNSLITEELFDYLPKTLYYEGWYYYLMVWKSDLDGHSLSDNCYGWFVNKHASYGVFYAKGHIKPINENGSYAFDLTHSLIFEHGHILMNALQKMYIRIKLELKNGNLKTTRNGVMRYEKVNPIPQDILDEYYKKAKSQQQNTEIDDIIENLPKYKERKNVRYLLIIWKMHWDGVSPLNETNFVIEDNAAYKVYYVRKYNNGFDLDSPLHETYDTSLLVALQKMQDILMKK